MGSMHDTILGFSCIASRLCWHVETAQSPLHMNNQLTLAGAKGLERGLVAQAVLAGLHHQCQTAVDVLSSLL